MGLYVEINPKYLIIRCICYH